MLIHHYDHQSGQYVGSGLADEDPRHPGRWLIPAWATADPLPERLSGTWPFYRNGAWALLPDHRGRVLYRRDNGRIAEILIAGVSPEGEGLTDSPRPSDNHVWQSDGWVLNPAAVARKKHDDAMAEFVQRMEHARRRNVGKADAYAAGLLDDEQIHYFKGWSAYQMALVREVEKETFPEGVVWPAEPGPYVPIEPIDRDGLDTLPDAAGFAEATGVRGMKEGDEAMSVKDMDDTTNDTNAPGTTTVVSATNAVGATTANEARNTTDTAETGNTTPMTDARERRPRRRPASDTRAD